MFKSKIHFDADYLITALRKHDRQSHNYLRPILQKAFMAIIFLVTLGLCAMLIEKQSPRDLILVVILASVLACLPLRMRYLEWVTRRNFAKSPRANQDYLFEIDEDGFRATSHDEDAHLHWPVFTKVVEFADGYLIYQGPQVFNWIPLTSLEDPSQAAALGDLLRKHIDDQRTIAPLEVPGEDAYNRC